MINLIPPEAKKHVRNEYWVRVISVWLMLLGAGALMVGVLYVPVYVLIQSQLESYSSKYEVASSENSEFVAAEKEVQRANTVALLLSSKKESVKFSDLLETLESLSGPAVAINDFSFSRTETEKVSNITIIGIAQSRQALVAFSQAIENDELFESAEIPISNLAKDSDIPFSIRIVLATP